MNGPSPRRGGDGREDAEGESTAALKYDRLCER